MLTLNRSPQAMILTLACTDDYGVRMPGAFYSPTATRDTGGRYSNTLVAVVGADRAW